MIGSTVHPDLAIRFEEEYIEQYDFHKIILKNN